MHPFFEKNMDKRKWIILYAILGIGLSACTHQLHIDKAVTSQYSINGEIAPDSTVNSLIAPYRRSLDSQMNQVIGSFAYDMKKERPEGTLGNWMADAVKNYVENIKGNKVDMVLLNYGGIRIPEIKKGEVTLGKMYELMPFENEVVMLSLSGKTLLALCTLIVEKEGEPVAGLQLAVHSRNPVQFTARIGGEVIDEYKLYTVATSDYLANGGDNYALLKEHSGTEPVGVKLRDVLIASFLQQPQPSYPALENRVYYTYR